MLTGRAALVTGGSRGIGAAIARRLAEAGADVAVTCTSSPDRAAAVADEIKEVGRRGLAIRADSAGRTDPADAVEQTVAEFGRLDILVNNAGIFPTTPFEELTAEEIDHTFAVHVRAAFLAAQAAARHLPAGGRIITIGSNLGERVPGPGMTLYAASKSALTGFTQGLARDLGPRGITVNLVNPGPTDTDMNPADGPGADGRRARSALGRYNDPADVAEAVLYLAGDGGRNITGTAILVDAGANA